MFPSLQKDKKRVLVVGATGATGKHVVQFLLNQGHHVVAVARSEEKMMSLLSSTQNKDEYSQNLTVKELSLSVSSPADIQGLTGGCNAIVRYVGFDCVQNCFFFAKE
jgi:short-subunit dehydrogenase